MMEENRNENSNEEEIRNEETRENEGGGVLGKILLVGAGLAAGAVAHKVVKFVKAKKAEADDDDESETETGQKPKTKKEKTKKLSKKQKEFNAMMDAYIASHDAVEIIENDSDEDEE